MRDLRDPQKLGEWLLSQRTADKKHPLSYWADIVEEQRRQEIVNIPSYPQEELLSTVTAREYRQELQERAEAGDRYALSLLQGKEWDEPGE